MNIAPITLPNQNVQDRIFDAANRLYDEANRQSYPTVDAVRKLAKVNMNDASLGMRTWRSLQSTQIAPVASLVPESLQQASTTTLANLWSAAVELANSTLRAAQESWDAERAEAEALRAQIASAYESQSTELELAQEELAQLRGEGEAQRQSLSELQKIRDAQNAELTQANTTATQMNMRAVEIERRAAELRTELDHAHAALSAMQSQLDDVRKSHQSEVSGLREELQLILQRHDTRETAMQNTLLVLGEETRQLQEQFQSLTTHNGSHHVKKNPTKNHASKTTT